MVNHTPFAVALGYGGTVTHRLEDGCGLVVQIDGAVIVTQLAIHTAREKVETGSPLLVLRWQQPLRIIKRPHRQVEVTQQLLSITVKEERIKTHLRRTVCRNQGNRLLGIVGGQLRIAQQVAVGLFHQHQGLLLFIAGSRLQGKAEDREQKGNHLGNPAKRAVSQ